MNKNEMSPGFTLIELLLYISIAAFMLLTISFFLGTLFESRIKNQTIVEVEQQGLQVMQTITQATRNAEAINSPAIGENSSSLSLDVVTLTDDPTVFDLSDGEVRVTEGASLPVSLTNSRVGVSALTFKNLSRTGTPGIIRVQFTITHLSPEGRSEYNYEKTFYGSASIR
jgi:type II secretory pathway pseudopilin PulG